MIFGELRRVVSGGMLLNVGRLWRKRRELLWWTDLLERAEQAGWTLVDTLVWVRPNANPIHGEVLASSHEYVFLLGDPDSFDPDAVRTEYAPGSEARLNRKWVHGRTVKGHVGDPVSREANPTGARARSFVTVYTGREKGNPHPAPMALEFAEHLVLLSGGQTIIDPFAGSGTTAVATRKLGKSAVLIESKAAYCAMAADRLSQLSLLAETTQM